MLGITGRLPLQPTPLIGRDREVAAIGQRLGAGGVRLLTLSGPPGVGKTRLAIAVASQLSCSRRPEAAPGPGPLSPQSSILGSSFADGSVFIDLAPLTDPGFVVSAIARTLGVHEAAGQPLLATLTNALAETPILLLLDNFEHVLGAAPVLADLLAACPGLVMLVTSRAPLHLRWEHEHPVSPLALPDPHDAGDLGALTASPAVALFIERTRAIRPGFCLSGECASAVAAICTRLDGLPLAIELAAARLRREQPQTLLARLQDSASDSPLHVLSGGAADAPARQRTLHAAIDWSYRLLSDAEQALFRRLSVFASGCALVAAEAGCGDPTLSSAAVLDGLAGLADAALLRQEAQRNGEPRYRMLEMIRAYAAEGLKEGGEAEAVHRRHASFCLARAEEAESWLKSGERKPWLAGLDAELDELRAALAWSESDAATAETGLRLAAALEWYWHFRNHWREGRDWLERLLARAGAEVSAAVRAKALYGSGRLAVFLGDQDAARLRLDESIAIFRELADPRGLAYALAYLSRLAWQTDGAASAHSIVEESVSLFRKAGDRWGLALSLFYRASAAVRAGDGASRAAADEGVALFRDLGDEWGIALVSEVLCGIAARQGDYAVARAVALEALRLRRNAGEKLAIGTSLVNVGDVTWLQGLAAEAAACYQEALALHRGLNNRLESAGALRRLGYVAQADGDQRQAAACFADALTFYQERGSVLGIMLCLAGLAAVACAIGQPQRAARLAGAGETLAATLDAPLTAFDQHVLDRNLASVRAGLNSDTNTTSWSEGRTMSLEQAVAEAKALAGEVAARTAARSPQSSVLSPRYPDGLTERQVEILCLLATGRSNAEVADALVLSVRTVERHVENIYEKLGVHGKAARSTAIAYALTHGLSPPAQNDSPSLGSL